MIAWILSLFTTDGYDPRFGMHPSSQSLIREAINQIDKEGTELDE